MSKAKRNVVSSKKIKTTNHGKNWTKTDIKELKSLVKQKNSCKQIAQSLGRTIPSIWNIMSTKGLRISK